MCVGVRIPDVHPQKRKTLSLTGSYDLLPWDCDAEGGWHEQHFTSVISPALSRDSVIGQALMSVDEEDSPSTSICFPSMFAKLSLIISCLPSKHVKQFLYRVSAVNSFVCSLKLITETDNQRYANAEDTFNVSLLGCKSGSHLWQLHQGGKTNNFFSLSVS